MCTMQPENREYFVQAMPVNRMNCVGKSSINAQSNGAANLEILPFLQHIMITLFFAYFWATCEPNETYPLFSVCFWEKKKM